MMEDLIQELKQLLLFKDTTVEGDIVILASAEPKMLIYALITAIEPDPQKKRSWWNVSMQVLTLPPRKVIWTLREPQFTGQEVFTFDDVEHFMKAIDFKEVSGKPTATEGPGDTANSARSKLRVVK